jgi:hypothetical protein
MTYSPRALNFWVTYHAARLRVLLDDATLSQHVKQEWLDEFAEDLTDLVTETTTADDAQQAVQLAEAMHAFIFHDGPEPVDPSID